MSTLIAATTAAANSSDFTLTDGQSATLYLRDAAGPLIDAAAVAKLLIKTGSEYFETGEKLTADKPARVLKAIGTFRIAKEVSTAAYGVDRD